MATVEGGKALRLATESVRAHADSIGYITFDDVDFGLDAQAKAGTVTSYMISDKDPPRGIYVQIGDRNNGDVTFVGRILDGPFYTQKPGAYYLIELTSMLVGNQRLAVQTRPKPASPVNLLDPKDVQEYVGATGDFTIGRLAGQSDVKIAIDSAGLTRHIGIFGTTGGGKSNSLQVITEEASEAKRAVLIFDIEGEYVAMNEPTDVLVPLLAKFGRKPKAMRNFQVYVPAPNSSKNIDAKKFGIPFSEIDLEIFSEVLGLTPFERVYLYDVAKGQGDFRIVSPLRDR